MTPRESRLNNDTRKMLKSNVRKRLCKLAERLFISGYFGLASRPKPHKQQIGEEALILKDADVYGINTSQK